MLIQIESDEVYIYISSLKKDVLFYMSGFILLTKVGMLRWQPY